MKQYLDICKKALNGTWKENRTGVKTIGYHGDMMKFNMSDGFPAITTKKLAFNSCVAEMLGFLRGYDNAEDFRRLGCKVWDANANDNEQWLNNPHRKGVDDLGRVYGVQARQWWSSKRDYDQLKKVVAHLSQDIDDRREIVSHWRPDELDMMALPPCHLLYQFGLEPYSFVSGFGSTVKRCKLNLMMYQRSCDLPLGVPFNIAGYAWLLHVVARITGHTPGTFTWVGFDIHIYENQIKLMKEQIKREPKMLPELRVNPDIKTLEDLETWIKPSNFILDGYDFHPAIKYPFAV